ncbi:T9SS sorting signal type C domain-containing protein [Flavobacterium sp. WLB]|nr:T9SS sorting signal type C domain-containing protein [Flavobacterium sp. WLB]
MNGKLLFEKRKLNEFELVISNLRIVHQIMLVKVILEDDFSKTKKIIF